MASISFVFDEGRLQGRLRADLMVESGPVRSDLQRRAKNVRERARQLVGERSAEPTGELAGSIRFVTTRTGEDSYRAQVGSDLRKAIWVEEGTGVHGPHRTPIVPTGGQFMRFRSRMFVGFISARSVLGQPGKHYLRDALQAARD